MNIYSLNEKSDFIFYLWVERDTSVIIRSLVAADSFVSIGCLGKYMNCLPLDETTYILSIYSLKALSKSYKLNPFPLYT